LISVLFCSVVSFSLKKGAGNGGMNCILDQVTALKWVQSHIAGFGGDPAKVTIGGQSSGASSVYGY